MAGAFSYPEWYFKETRARVLFARYLGAAILLLMTAIPSFPQTLGLKLAYPNADVFQSNTSASGPIYSFNARPIKIGLTGELALRSGVLVEFDALYSRPSYASTNIVAGASTRDATVVNCWDLSTLLKKEFSHTWIKPFIDGGTVFQVVNATSDMTTPAFPSPFRPPEFLHQAVVGFAAGSGVDLKIGRFHVEPEFRYIRFAARNFQAPAATFQSNVEQPMFLLGLQTGFGSHR